MSNRLKGGQPDGSVQAGYASHFEARPEPIFMGHVRLMVDASVVRKRQVGELKVFHIPHVWSGRDEIFLGFGKPNTYLVCRSEGAQPTDAKPSYQKFAGKSLKRAPSVIEDTRLFVQQGAHVRFLNVPDRAHAALQTAMKKHHGNKYWTCVNACLRVLEDAGFSFGRGGKRLSSIYFPYALFKALLKHGLYFEGQPVGFEFVRTADDDLNEYMWTVIQAELTTFCRHADRAIDGKAEAGSKVWKGIRVVRHAPANAWKRAFPPKPKAPKPTPKVAPPLPADGNYLNDVRVEMATPSLLGLIMRMLWGQHVLFRLSQSRVRHEDFIDDEPLKPFPGKLSLASRLKKWFLFSPPVVHYILRHLAPRWEDLGTFDERTVHAMLRTHTDEAPNKYNVVITRRNIVIARTAAGSGWFARVLGKLADWILSKHVLLGDWENVPWAGEGWKNLDASVALDGNSGTYKPSDSRTRKAVRLVNAIMPSWQVVFHTSVRGEATPEKAK